MILMIDNYDSFVYNLYQLIGQFNQDIKIVRNDQITIEEINEWPVEAIIISPGPGKAKNAGNCEEIIKAFYHKIPILGICLGHQAIIEAFGGTVGYAQSVMHGKSSIVTVDTDSAIFHGVNEQTKVGRYHSLAGEKENWPEELKIISSTDEGEIMAFEHKDYPVFGLQFHPESILTDEGSLMIKNFLEMVQKS